MGSNRESYASNISSSAASFRTAPSPLTATSALHQSSSSLSMHTVGPENIHVHPKEVHILAVTSDAVQPAQFFKTIANVGPPPPSPPASEDGQPVILDDPEQLSESPVPAPIPAPAPTSAPARECTSSSTTVPHRAGTVSLPMHRPDSKQSTFSTRTRFSESHSHPPETPSISRQAAHVSVDGFLHPPPPSIAISFNRDRDSTSSSRPVRRNTTGSTPRTPTFPSTSHIHFSTTGDGELASDIQLAAEQIRRERASKRVKAQQKQAEEEQKEREREAEKEDTVLVGNLIGKDHVNYVLMYNMLTGIRIGVSRCQAKIKRPLTDDDFMARHKYTFDIVGNELTPSTPYDFKFKDYAPWVFRSLREDHFHLDPADYLLSLTSKYILSELGSPGKSGSFFYFSRDYRFIIKTIRKEECSFLLKVLKKYYEHVKENPHTLLSRFYGLHRVKLPRGRKIHFVIMNNLFPPHRDIHETYDLKGSTVGREYPEALAQANPRAVLKDVNWVKRGKRLELGPEKRALLTEQLRRDKEFLKSVDVMDYSLLVGVHDVKRGNKDDVREKTLKVFSPNLPTLPTRPSRHPTSKHKPSSYGSEANAMRRAMRSSDPKKLGKGKGTIRLPETLDSGDRRHFWFYQDEGGLRATDEGNVEIGMGGGEEGEGGTIYYLGVIDILTPYGFRKKCEHFWKGLKDERHKISPIPPGEYADRFFEFMKAIMRGGNGGWRFLPEKERGRWVEKQKGPDGEKQEDGDKEGAGFREGEGEREREEVGCCHS